MSKEPELLIGWLASWHRPYPRTPYRPGCETLRLQLPSRSYLLVNKWVCPGGIGLSRTKKDITARPRGGGFGVDLLQITCLKQRYVELNPMPGDKTDLHTRRNCASISPERYLAKQLDFLLFYEIAHTIPSSFKYRV